MLTYEYHQFVFVFLMQKKKCLIILSFPSFISLCLIYESYVKKKYLGSTQSSRLEPQANYVYSSNPVEQLISNSLLQEQPTSTRRQDTGRVHIPGRGKL